MWIARLTRLCDDAAQTQPTTLATPYDNLPRPFEGLLPPQLFPAGQPPRSKIAVGDRGPDRALRLAIMATVAEPAADRQLGDIRERALEAHGRLVEADQPYPGGVEHRTTVRQRDQRPVGGRVPPATVGPQRLGPHHRRPGQRIDQAGLPGPARPQEAQRLPVR